MEQNISKPFKISQGLQDRHIAVWQSHGKFYKNDRNEWRWQRPRLFGTTEDLYTQSIVVPYLIPMLETPEQWFLHHVSATGKRMR